MFSNIADLGELHRRHDGTGHLVDVDGDHGRRWQLARVGLLGAKDLDQAGRASDDRHVFARRRDGVRQAVVCPSKCVGVDDEGKVPAAGSDEDGSLSAPGRLGQDVAGVPEVAGVDVYGGAGEPVGWDHAVTSTAVSVAR
jgi:hypothetical protein